jgi:hypothetical protein
MLYFLRTTALNLPQLTRAAGIVLILVVGLIHMYKVPMHFEAASYIGAAFVANFVASLVAALGIWLGAPNWGWLLGAYVAGGAFVAYLVSRAVGLAGFEEAVGNWANPWGSFALIVEGLYLVGYFSVTTGVAVAAPEKRDWHS